MTALSIGPLEESASGHFASASQVCCFTVHQGSLHVYQLASLVDGSFHICGLHACMYVQFRYYRASGRSRKKSVEFRGIFRGKFGEKRLVKNGRFHGSFASKFHWKAIGFCADLRNVVNKNTLSYSVYTGFIPQYEIVLYK